MHPHVAALHGNKRILARSLALTVSFGFVELFTGWFSGSLTLTADAGHMFADSAALLIAFFAAWLATRRAPPEKTFGYFRTEALAGMVSGVLLLVLVVMILYSAVQRTIVPAREILGLPVLIVAVIGLVVNLAILQRLKAGKEIYMRAAFYEVLFDSVGSVLAIAAAAAILFAGFIFADVIFSIILAVLIIPRAMMILKLSSDVILEAAPTHIDFEELKQTILDVNGVKELHDLHVWQISTGFVTMSCHIVADNPEVEHDIEEMLHKKYHIWHATVQLEPKPLKEKMVHGRWSV